MHGGAIYARSGDITVTNGYFSGDTASCHGGAIVINVWGKLNVSSTTFIESTVIAGGGWAIHSGVQQGNILLTNNTFSHNTVPYCGVLDVDEFYHYTIRVQTFLLLPSISANIVGNTFTHNRAVGKVAGGGVICIGNASISVLDNNFSHNLAAGDAGVLRVDECDVTVKRSIFSNNMAGGNGGVFYTSFHPTSYTITQTSFTNKS